MTFWVIGWRSCVCLAMAIRSLRGKDAVYSSATRSKVANNGGEGWFPFDKFEVESQSCGMRLSLQNFCCEASSIQWEGRCTVALFKFSVNVNAGGGSCAPEASHLPSIESETLKEDNGNHGCHHKIIRQSKMLSHPRVTFDGTKSN